MRKNNNELQPKYGLRKLSVGFASVLLGFTMFAGMHVHADSSQITNHDQITVLGKPIQPKVTEKVNGQVVPLSGSIVQTNSTANQQTVNDPQIVSTSSDTDNIGAVPVETQTMSTQSTNGVGTEKAPEANHAISLIQLPELQPETQANLTVTDSTNGQAFPAETNGNIDTEYRLSTIGQFSVKIGDLLNRQRVKLADVTTTSTSGKFMNFSANTGGFHVNYEGQYLGNLDWSYDQDTGKGSIFLQSVLVDSPFKELSNNAIISVNLLKVPNLVSLNWETDPHRFVPLDPDGSFHETLTITSVGSHKTQSLLFKMKPKRFDHENDPMWINVTASSSVNNSTFSDYVTPLMDKNTGSMIDDLNNGTANLKLDGDAYTLYYLLKPMGNSKLNLDDFSIYVNKLPNAIGSDGRMTKETLWINGPDLKQMKGQDGVTFQSAGNDLSFADLARNDFNGAEWSLQDDGSARVVLRVPKKWIQLTDGDYFQLADSTITGVFDKNGEDAAEASAKNFYAQLDNMPMRFVIGFWLPYSQDKLHHDNHYALQRLAEDGTVIYHNSAKQPDSQVDLQGQTQINVHFVNAYDGSDVTLPLSSIGWPGKDQLKLDWTKLLPAGYDYGKLIDGNLLNGNQYTLPAGYTLLSDQPAVIDYPAKDVANYVVFITPKTETSTIHFVDNDDKDAKFTDLTTNGYFGQKIVFAGYGDAMKQLHDQHYVLAGNDFMPGQEIYKLASNNYVVYLNHDHQEVNREKVVTRTVNLHDLNGDVHTTKQTIKLTQTEIKDLVTGKTTSGGWSKGEFAAMPFTKIAGYTLDNSVDTLLVTGDSNDSAIDVHYIANPQELTIHYMDTEGQEILPMQVIKGVTDQVLNKITYQVPEHYALMSAGVKTFKLTANSEDNQLALVVVPKLDFRSHLNGDEDLNKVVNRTINIMKPDGKVQTVVQSVMFYRDDRQIEITGEHHYTAWTPAKDSFEAYLPDVVDGYLPPVIKSQGVTSNDQDTVVNVSYQKLSETHKPLFIDVNGIGHDTIPEGYHVVAGQAERSAGSMLIVKDVKPVLPQLDFVTRTITIEMPNGNMRTIRQRVKKGTKFAAVHMPKLRGYTISSSTDQLGVVNANEDINLHVKYVKS